MSTDTKPRLFRRPRGQGTNYKMFGLSDKNLAWLEQKSGRTGQRMATGIDDVLNGARDRDTQTAPPATAIDTTEAVEL